eukprot:CAMPEP_0197310486 /NCGR_PEP_ID=MMETSP0891-20130614/9069_1 /TAXON_ID=44058 ORGANISM="Aureoumbra lagunensis, Strain CCMP1510" /NCGR_SAMPLE_ID=MMETSP0891 /ASSEMBLY_ACC=CAM_ASM_000534 /LENGTH=477 /DNA_ID=CAMNT_0042796153 /DNA_START=14 /DNA_END=1450 /DNA_ORIENTATION=+
MRLLPKVAASKLYDRIYDLCSNHGLIVQRDEIRTISGADEAYYAALAVNYAFGQQVLLGALDLGGASTQIAAPLHLKKNKIHPEPKNFAVSSYLGYGVEVLSSRYFARMPVTACTHTVYDPARFFKCQESIAHFLGIQHCPPMSRNKTIRVRKFIQNATCQLPELYPTSDQSSPSSSSNLCIHYDVSQRLNEKTSFIATSLYYYAWRTLIQMLRFAGNISQADALAREWPKPSLINVRAGAKTLCAKSLHDILALANDNTQPWDSFIGNNERRQREMPRRCFDLAYIDILLDRVFGLSDRQVAVAIAVDELDLDWTLGYALDHAVRLAQDSFTDEKHGRIVQNLSILRDENYTIFFVFVSLSVLFALIGCCFHGRRAAISGSSKKEKCDRPVGIIARSGMRLVWGAPVVKRDRQRDIDDESSTVPFYADDAASPTRARNWGSRQSSVTKLSSLGGHSSLSSSSIAGGGSSVGGTPHQ